MARITRRQLLKMAALGLGAGALSPLLGVEGAQAAGDTTEAHLSGGSSAGFPAFARSRVSFEQELALHPALQYGAQVEPDRRVSVLVQKARHQVATKSFAAGMRAELVGDDIDLVKTAVLEVPQRLLARLAANPDILYVSPDIRMGIAAINASALKTTHQPSLEITNAWNGVGMPATTGSGVTVAVVDSGVDTKHPAFSRSDKLVAKSVTGKPTSDENGHGTHVIGIINGWDAQGRYIGVAPNARVVSVRVSDKDGSCTEADLLRGLDWVYKNRSQYNIKVLNLSITGQMVSDYTTSPICAAVEQLWLAGVTVIVAAGNRGSEANAVAYAPANDRFAITVGALDGVGTPVPWDDQLAWFSSRGWLNNWLYYKPEVVVPGRKIVAPLASDSLIKQQFADRITDTNYVRLSGTSMAAPIVAGIVALILEKYPNLTPNQIKWLMKYGIMGYAGQTDSAHMPKLSMMMMYAAAGNVASENQGVALNRGINAATKTVNWTQAYWDQAYWDQAYWDQATLESMAID
ncbi:MAG: S8 family peptidase [Thermomicrobiales bacterium]